MSEVLERYRRTLPEHLRAAAEFLTRCQLREPWVSSGLLYGAVAPWELGHYLGAYEDFHDTLEAIWVWTLYTYVTGREDYLENMDLALTYVRENYRRFVSRENPEYQYDAAHLLHTALALEKLLSRRDLESCTGTAAELCAEYLREVGERREWWRREYRDPWWVLTCLYLYSRERSWGNYTQFCRDLLYRVLSEEGDKFLTAPEEEPRHRGRGGHDFFCHTASRVIALTLLLSEEEPELVRRILREQLLPRLPKNFVTRHVDEHAWNAHLATALALAYHVTGTEEFLRTYDIIMEELWRRSRGTYVLPRSANFPLPESWVTYFYTQAHVALVLKLV